MTAVAIIQVFLEIVGIRGELQVEKRLRSGKRGSSSWAVQLPIPRYTMTCEVSLSPVFLCVVELFQQGYSQDTSVHSVQKIIVYVLAIDMALSISMFFYPSLILTWCKIVCVCELPFSVVLVS